MRRVVSFLFLVLVLGAPSRPAAAQASPFPPFLTIDVPVSPGPIEARGERYLCYEMRIASLAPGVTRLTGVEVRSPGGDVLLDLGTSDLETVVLRPGTTLSGEDALSFEGGTHGIVYIWVPFGPGLTIPDHLVNRVQVEEERDGRTRTGELQLSVAVLPATDVPQLGPPLRGGPWLAANGPSNVSGHRRTVIPLHGRPNISQRYAIDYVKVGDDNQLYSGDEENNADHHAYGEEAIAVADAVVASVLDGVVENVPGVNSRAVEITLETVAGNYVILDLGGGRFAFYAHFQPGSIRVAPGDRVRRGDVIGLVGNSGNSTAPHLHFHVSDGNSPLGSQGRPYAHDRFEWVGECPGFTNCTRGEAQPARGEIPLNFSLVRFPG